MPNTKRTKHVTRVIKPTEKQYHFKNTPHKLKLGKKQSLILSRGNGINQFNMPSALIKILFKAFRREDVYLSKEEIKKGIFLFELKAFYLENGKIFRIEEN